MWKGDARQAFPEASLSGMRPTREVAGTCRPVPERPVNHPAGAPGSETQSPRRRRAPGPNPVRGAWTPPSPRSVPAGPQEPRVRRSFLRRCPFLASPPPPFCEHLPGEEQMWAPAVTGCICSILFTGIQTRPQWAAFVRALTK